MTIEFSIADEIVGADGTAKIGPPMRAPVIDQTYLTYQGFEPFGLTHWGMQRKPKRSKYRGAQKIDFGPAFGEFHDAIKRPGKGVNQSQITLQERQTRGRICFGWQA